MTWRGGWRVPCPATTFAGEGQACRRAVSRPCAEDGLARPGWLVAPFAVADGGQNLFAPRDPHLGMREDDLEHDTRFQDGKGASGIDEEIGRPAAPGFTGIGPLLLARLPAAEPAERIGEEQGMDSCTRHPDPAGGHGVQAMIARERHKDFFDVPPAAEGVIDRQGGGARVGAHQAPHVHRAVGVGIPNKTEGQILSEGLPARPVGEPGNLAPHRARMPGRALGDRHGAPGRLRVGGDVHLGRGEGVHSLAHTGNHRRALRLELRQPRAIQEPDIDEQCLTRALPPQGDSGLPQWLREGNVAILGRAEVPEHGQRTRRREHGEHRHHQMARLGDPPTRHAPFRQAHIDAVDGPGRPLQAVLRPQPARQRLGVGRVVRRRERREVITEGLDIEGVGISGTCPALTGGREAHAELIEHHRAVKDGCPDAPERGLIRQRACQQHFAEQRRRNRPPLARVGQDRKHLDRTEIERKVQQIIGLQLAIRQQPVARPACQPGDHPRIIADDHLPGGHRQAIAEPLIQH